MIMTGGKPNESEHGPCPDCGLLFAPGHGLDERYHRRVHDEALNGHRAKLHNGFHVVTHKSPIALQKLAQAAASAARRETEYDFSSFAAIKKAADEYNTIAMVYVEEGRVCGLLVSRERECEYTANLSSFQADGLHSWRPTAFTQVEGHARRAIDMIWVLKKKRKQGVATGLAEALAAHCKIKTEELAHMIPFSEDAVRLWKARNLSTIYVV
jgi:hypothetical protein